MSLRLTVKSHCIFKRKRQVRVGPTITWTSRSHMFFLSSIFLLFLAKLPFFTSNFSQRSESPSAAQERAHTFKYPLFFKKNRVYCFLRNKKSTIYTHMYLHKKRENPTFFSSWAEIDKLGPLTGLGGRARCLTPPLAPPVGPHPLPQPPSEPLTSHHSQPHADEISTQTQGWEP